MSENIKRVILDKIKEYKKIIIMRHIRPDGDAVGSTMGLKEILKASFPDKEILLINEDYSDYLSFMEKEDRNICDDAYGDALGIVLDTATEDRISNKKFSLCREKIKIDHHVDIKPYGDYSWVEDQSSSVCEMITEFYMEFCAELKINKAAATCLYTGMVTDSGRFRFSSTSGDTMRRAATLLDCGIDTDTLFSNLYLDDFSQLKYKAHVYKTMKLTENGVAYLFVSRKMQSDFSLSPEQASNAVSYLDGIKGSIIWLAFIENEDKTIRVRLRSRFVTINKLAEKYGGGGHECASGATAHSRKEMNALISDADALIREYKETHEGWL